MSKVLLYKDSFATGLIGLVFVASLLAGRPLAYYFGQRFAGGGTREGDRWWAAMWDASPGFRRSQRLITVIWAVAFLVEALVKTIAIRVSTYSTGYIWDQILPIVAIAVALILTLVVVRRGQAEGKRRRPSVDHRSGPGPDSTPTTNDFPDNGGPLRRTRSDDHAAGRDIAPLPGRWSGSASDLIADKTGAHKRSNSGRRQRVGGCPSSSHHHADGGSTQGAGVLLVAWALDEWS